MNVYRWQLIAVLFFAAGLNYGDRAAISSVFPLLKDELGLSDLALGGLGSAFLWAYAIGSPLAGAYEAPGRGYHWGMATFHPDLPRGTRVRTSPLGTLKEILLGPAPVNDGSMNLFGALRTSMATCGYQTVKEFQKAEVMVAPALQTEGKVLQRSQGVGMG